GLRPRSLNSLKSFPAPTAEHATLPAHARDNFRGADHPRGLLRINTAVSFGAQHLALALIEFQRRYPDARISLSLTDYPADLQPIRSMSAVPVGPLCDSRLMLRKIGEVERVIRASPKYLNQFAIPKCRDDLTQHRCVVFTAPGRSRWAFRTAN